MLNKLFASTRFRLALNLFLAGAAAIFFTRKILPSPLFSGEGYWNHNFSSWMINYSGGYVRRGLLGEIVYRICLATGWDVASVCAVAGLASFAALAAWFLCKFRKHGLNWWLLPMSVFLGGVPVYRTDALIFLLAIAVFSLALGGRGLWRIVVANLIGVAAINMHEMFAFIALPLLYLALISREDDWKKGLAKATISIAPMCLATLVLCAFWGDASNRDAIFASWNALYPGRFDISTSALLEIKGLGMTFSDAWGGMVWGVYDFHVADTPLRGGFLLPFVVAAEILCFVVLPFWGREEADSSKRRRQRAILKMLAFQMVALSPMWFVLSDLSRFAFFWAAPVFIALFFMEERGIALPVLSWNRARGEALLERMNRRNLTIVVLAVFFGLQMYPSLNLSAVVSNSAAGNYLQLALAAAKGQWSIFVNESVVP